MKLVRNETPENIDGIGVVRFEQFRRENYANRTHSQRFAFEVNGREYWGEIVRYFDRAAERDRVGYDVNLMTRNTRTGSGQSIAWNAKADWRLALRIAFRSHLEAYLAAEEADRRTELEAESDGIEFGETGPDWEPTAATRYYAQRGKAFAMGATKAAAIVALREAMEAAPNSPPSDPLDSISDVATLRGDELTEEEEPDALAIGPDPDAAGAFLISGNGWRVQVYADRQADGPTAKHYLSGSREGVADVFESRSTLAEAIRDAVSLAARDGRWPAHCYGGEDDTPVEDGPETDTAATVAVGTPVPWQRLCDLLCTGIEGGYSPWIHRFYRVGTWAGESPAYYQPEFWRTSGGQYAAEFDSADDAEGDDTGRATVDAAALVKAVQVMAEKEPRHFADFIAENDDAITGDVFLQCLLLGEVIYG